MTRKEKRAQNSDSAPNQGYQCIVADPPWAPRDKLPGKSRGAARQYNVMATRDICLLADPWTDGSAKVYGRDIADDAILFLWRLASMQDDALEVAKWWGFRVVSEVVWTKQTLLGRRWFGMGRTVRASHETALVCVRGRSSKIVRSKSVRSVFEAPVPTDERGAYIHSAKPGAFFTEVVEPLTGGPGAVRCLEVFARRRRPGWDAIGDQLPSDSELATPEMTVPAAKLADAGGDGCNAAD